MPPARAEIAFASYETKDWTRTLPGGKMIPITNWRGAAHTCYAYWKADNPQAYTAAKRAIETAERNRTVRGPYAE